MSAAAIDGGDAVKSAPALTSKQQMKTSNSGKVLDGARRQAASPVDGQSKKQQQQQQQQQPPPPRQAWAPGQPNPITQQRASTGTPNGAERALSRGHAQPQPQSSKNTSDSQVDKHAHERSIFLLSHFIGKDVTIALKNGEQFSGVFSGASLDASKTHYVIKMARRTKPPGHQQINGNVESVQDLVGEGDDHLMSFDIQDTADLFVADVNTSAAAPHQNGSITGSFRTDTEISTREATMRHERELQRWDAGPDSSIDMSLDAEGSVGWDQFDANERMYGVQSTYDENIYTTAIDRSNPAYRGKKAEADRIAREIEGSAPANAHVAEERRTDADRDDAGDEEDKYSGVRRELPKRAANAYVPPSQRPITHAPTVPGAPFDPAIISAQLAKPTSSPTAGPEPTASASQQSVTVEQPSPAVSAEASKDASAPAANLAQPANKKENTTENRLRDTADAFKQFANGEKLRLRQAQEAKRSNLRQEKNVKLNDLKKFAANFKLRSRVPDDLVPILAKSRDKQMEIQAKAEEAAKEEELKAKERLSDKASSAASPAPSAASTQTGAAPAADPRNTFNNRIRTSQQPRPGPALPGQTQSPRASLGQRIHHNQQLSGRFVTPQPAELRIPPVAPGPSSDLPMSPSSATRLNVNAKAFEFRPGAHAFTPTGPSPSPSRGAGGGVAEVLVPFLDKSKEIKSFSSSHDPLKRMAEAEYDEVSKKKFMNNGGYPQAYNTPPTWPCPKERESALYLSMWPQVSSQAPSPLHTPNPNTQMPHAHQLPPHIQQPSAMSTPAQRSPFYQQHNHVPSFDPRLQQFGHNGSVQNSPRAPQQMPVAPFNAHMTPMPGPSFPVQPMPGYGMSPSVQYRQPAMPGGPMMMMPGQQQGQMGPMQPGYGPGGQQFRGPQMGGHMMVQQHSSSGFANGPMPQPGFSPMPPHAQPHLNHMHQHGAPAAYSGSPRPPMMQHQGSHQGFQPGMPTPPHFAPSPGQAPYPYHLQQRAMSGGYPQMTPRQQHVMPHQPSPGMTIGQGDEGK